MWGAPGAPGGRGGTGIPPGGGGGIESLGGRFPTPLIRGGGRFTPAGGGGPLAWGRAFSILKWNWRKNWKEKKQEGYTLCHVLELVTQFETVVTNESICTCFVSLFQWVQKRFSALSISRLGT